MAQPLLRTVNFITIALLPEQIREEYGLSPPDSRRPRGIQRG
jgi:hypothetical protein